MFDLLEFRVEILRGLLMELYEQWGWTEEAKQLVKEPKDKIILFALSKAIMYTENQIDLNNNIQKGE